MATPRGYLAIALTNGGGEVYIRASVPTMADFVRVSVSGGSVVYTTQPTGLMASLLSASTGQLLTPANSPQLIHGPVQDLRFRDLGAAAGLFISFHEGNPGL